MSKWKGRTEDGFLCKSKVPDSQNHLDQSKHSKGSLPDPHAAHFHSTRGQRAEWMVTMRSLADHCVLEEGGLESHASIYLISKTAVPPTLVFRIMEHYALSAIKRMHLYDDITPLCSQG